MRNWARAIKRSTMVLWFATRHPDTPILVKFIAFVAVAYALSPIDLIPDFIPILGYLDDVILLPVLIWLAMKLCPQVVLQECQQKADDWAAQQQKRPVSVVGLMAIVLIWLCLGAYLALWAYQRWAEPAMGAL